MLKRIVLLDDRRHGIEQIQNALPRGSGYELIWCGTTADWKDVQGDVDVVLLDYRLEREGRKGTEVISKNRGQAGRIIAFSSRPEGNDKLLAYGADDAVSKLRHHHNPELTALFQNIFAKADE